MLVEKHKEILAEVHDAIEKALNDPKGLLKHQRRIGLMASLGMQQLIEIYFHKLNVIKPGTQVKHEWFKLEDRKLRLKLSQILTRNLKSMPRMTEISALAFQIETDRNDIVYGSPLKDDEKLKEKIDIFLELKKTIEDETGDINEIPG